MSTKWENITIATAINTLGDDIINYSFRQVAGVAIGKRRSYRKFIDWLRNGSVSYAGMCSPEKRRRKREEWITVGICATTGATIRFPKKVAMAPDGMEIVMSAIAWINQNGAKAIAAMNEMD